MKKLRGYSRGTWDESMIDASVIRQLGNNIKRAAARLNEGTALPLKRVRNEWEVVFLLGAIAAQGDCRLVYGSDRYPDASLEIETLDGKKHTVQVEVEYRASGFDHFSNPRKCHAIICWRKDADNFGDLAIIELEPLFPSIETDDEDAQINHANKPQAIREMFYFIEDWLFKRGLVGIGTGSTTETNTMTFRLPVADQRSLCSLQYYDDYLQFKWFKETIGILGKTEKFAQALTNIRDFVSDGGGPRSETEKEYRINLYPRDHRAITEVLAALDAIFDSL